MPIYEFRCPTCELTEEFIVLNAETPTTPKCGKCERLMIRVIGRTSFRLVGSGWSRDGYGGGSTTGGNSET